MSDVLNELSSNIKVIPGLQVVSAPSSFVLRSKEKTCWSHCLFFEYSGKEYRLDVTELPKQQAD